MDWNHDPSIDYTDLYPDILGKVHNQLQSYKLVVDETIPDEDCVIVEWSEDDGNGNSIKHRFRFYKDDSKMPEFLQKLNASRSEMKREMKRKMFIDEGPTASVNRDQIEHMIGDDKFSPKV